MTSDPANGESRAAREEVVGIVDLFGALTREELRRALSELAFKRGSEVDESAVAAAIDRAVHEYALVPLEVDGDAVDGEGTDPEAGTVLIAGPAAFPVLPPKADDLPYILDVPDREIDREAAGEHVERQLVDDVDAAIEGGNPGRLETLLEVTYDLESWAPIEVGDVRDRIADAMEGTNDEAVDDPTNGEPDEVSDEDDEE